MTRCERKCKVERKTKETSVSVEMDIDGEGKCVVGIEEPFLRHMVETLGRYASFDLKVKATGDMEHHLVEDVAITLGKALREAIGDVPIQRVASATVPMDEALVSASLDLVDRPFVDVQVPDLMYEHFFRSFAMESRATLHTQVVRGRDAHHIVEATFKAVGMALRDATKPRGSVLSTKSSVRWRKGR